MNEEELSEITIFWTLRNRILDDMRKAFPQAWPEKSEYFMEISLLATEGVCAREARKVERGLRHTVEELQAVSKKIDVQMERLHSNNIFAETDGIDWELLRDYFAMQREESENDGEETDA
tara:strand:+ start:198 stop:557 length:360 start_codon:yes stop_codon:yes gene_type:complete